MVRMLDALTIFIFIYMDFAFRLTLIFLLTSTTNAKNEPVLATAITTPIAIAGLEPNPVRGATILAKTPCKTPRKAEALPAVFP